MNFYSVIIGSELLNGRRVDGHFSFLNKELLKRGWEQHASFVIKDEPEFIEQIFTLIKNDPDSVMFCFGGIGATPDDFTRKCAGNVFTQSNMDFNEDAKDLIINQFGDAAYPHRVNMAYLPAGAKLLKNVVNQVPGFYLQNRFFFTPGFPSMSHPMVLEALDKFYPININIKHRLTFTADVGENEFINLMKEAPSNIEVSSLPQINGNKRNTVLSMTSYDLNDLEKHFEVYINYMKQNNISYILEDNKQNTN